MPTDSRFRFVTAAHHLVMDALPMRHPESAEALATFLDAAATCPLRSDDADAVLLRTLSILNSHTGGRLPSLVDRYLARRRDGSNTSPLACFEECVRDVIRFRGIGNSLVRKAIAIIESRFGDADLRQAAVAGQLGVTPSVLSVAFKDQTGVTVMEYLQAVRLDRAATLLTTTEKTIKEVWVHVGYNHPSNFDHDFKHRFGQTPSEYRARAIGATPSPSATAMGRSKGDVEPHQRSTERGTVLIVDDDEGTRDTMAAYLGKLLGYAVVTAATGEEGLRAAARVKPRRILLDYQLPDIDGISCLRALNRQDWGGARPSVVLFTADWSLEDREDEIRALGATMLSKLCELEDVKRVVGVCQPQSGDLAI